MPTDARSAHAPDGAAPGRAPDPTDASGASASGGSTGAPGSAAPRPLNEADRVAALEAYRILDSDPEQAYDDIVELAAAICDVPAAYISFIDRDRQWLKASVGVEDDEFPRDDAICAHTILAPDPVIVEDLTRDPRFRDSPFVATENGLRFYAGAPLVTPEGHGIGSLCVVDVKPRMLTGDQTRTLSSLAQLVMRELELRRTADRLSGILARVRVLAEHVPVCAGCGAMRNDDAYWERLETFLAEEAGSLVTHGICPDCAEREYSGIL